MGSNKFDWAKELHKPLVTEKYYCAGVSIDNKYLVRNNYTGKVSKWSRDKVKKYFGDNQ